MKIIDRQTMLQAEEMAFASGISYLRLMENAGVAVARVIRETVDVKNKNAVVVCGAGNNGGDGFVVARKLFENFATVSVVLVGGTPSTHNAKENFEKLSGDIKILDYTKFSDTCNNLILNCDILVDAVFGTGLSREPDSLITRLFGIMSKSSATTFSVDLPSGVVCDTAEIKTSCVKADYTVTFECLKPCHILPPSNEFCGKVTPVKIGIDEEIIERLPYVCKTIDKPTIRKRRKNDHKGTFGKGLSICGSYGMPGAAVIAAKSALRCGIGILKMACVKENYEISAISAPEAVLIPCKTNGGKYSLSDFSLLKEHLNTSDALLVGCGIGVSQGARELICKLILESTVPVIIDADGINCISSCIDIIKQAKAPIILTPHPAEMSRLCGKSISEIESSRIDTASEFANRYGVYVILKGANTVVATPKGETFVNLLGNAGMAKAGSGDMLSGIILALLAQGYEITEGVKSAVWLHSTVGDMAAEKLSETAMLPTDMINLLPDLLRRL
ncbi:MAG: NAD(P)H-hydrate dehydratase [Clostridia bacterium]|nr:NAD(P)H-hydrate dehydratase [Clostridia bacterium]